MKNDCDEKKSFGCLIAFYMYQMCGKNWRALKCYTLDRRFVHKTGFIFSMHSSFLCVKMGAPAIRDHS